MRVGVGYDSHRFEPSVPLVLGGVAIPNEPGLRGHSDGDAVAHAVIDALLGAASLGDIGRHFPDTDPALAGADSLELLRETEALLRAGGFRVGNLDVTVITERPRIRSHAAEMERRIADCLGIEADRVSVKGKSNEGLGWVGRGEGLAVLAVALIEEGDTLRHPAAGTGA